MALFDLNDPVSPLPSQLVLDTSLLLACRAGDDNPHTEAVQRFISRLGQEIAAFHMIAWLLTPVLQECYHIILSNNLRRSWEALPIQGRLPNWLVAYKKDPKLLAAGFEDIKEFDNILAAIPVTPVQPDDLLSSSGMDSLDERIRHFITRYFLLPQDALILAEAEHLGVTAVATLDSDWHRVAEFDI